jgi:hypothetical protein
MKIINANDHDDAEQADLRFGAARIGCEFSGAQR